MKHVILIFGNSGCGKSTLAKKLCSQYSIDHLDLDTVAWSKQLPATRVPILVSQEAIKKFIHHHSGCVIEGCYGDLIQASMPLASEIVYLDISVEKCIENAKKRPWEPHKYESKEAQDKNLNMLIEWIRGYVTRNDSLSKNYHENLFESFEGKKSRIKS